MEISKLEFAGKLLGTLRTLENILQAIEGLVGLTVEHKQALKASLQAHKQTVQDQIEAL